MNDTKNIAFYKATENNDITTRPSIATEDVYRRSVNLKWLLIFRQVRTIQRCTRNYFANAERNSFLRLPLSSPPQTFINFTVF